MVKEYMVGTVDDKPLLMVTLRGVNYFVDTDSKEVFYDKPKLPLVTDEETIAAVLKVSNV